MPLDDLQKAVFATLRANRNPDSHVAGAAAIHRDPGSPRYSDDIDLFHDAAEVVAANAEQDAQALRAAGFEVNWQVQRLGFRRAWVARGSQGLKIEWLHDSAFRFFPVQPDPVLGYRLHDADLAVNKVLAGVGRLVIRDFLDLIHLHRSFLHLGALAWAAVGKDPGLTPLLILNELSRHAKYRAEELAEVKIRCPVSLTELKTEWLEILNDSRRLVEGWPADDVGCLYLDANGRPSAAENPRSEQLRIHFGSLKGSWPGVGDALP